MRKTTIRILAALLACLLSAVLLTGCDATDPIDGLLGLFDKGIDFFYSLKNGTSTSASAAGASGTQPAVDGKFMKDEDFVWSAGELFTLPHLTDAEGKEYPELCGCCTDGEYLYFAMCDGQAAAPTTMFAKVDLTGRVMMISTPARIPHINDMCYNPVSGKIVAVHSAPQAQNLTVIDAAALTVDKTENILLQIYAITYSEAENCYYAGILYGYNFARLDADFNVTRTFSGRVVSAAQEGIDTDGEFVYFLFSGDPTAVVYDLNGFCLGEIPLPDVTDTPQNLFDIDEKLYVICAASGEGATGAVVWCAAPAEAGADTETEGEAEAEAEASSAAPAKEGEIHG